MKHQGLCFGLGILAFQGLHAGTMGELSTYLQGVQKVATITAGPDFVYQGGSQTRTLSPPFQNTYVSDKQWKGVGDFGGFLGLERAFRDWLGVQTGLSGYGNASIPISGDVWQFGLPKFDNFSYSYHVSHARVMWSNKWLTNYPRYAALHPYFSWEIGAAFNRASGYQERALIPLTAPMSPFHNHNQTSFSWSLGLGADYAVNEKIRVGLGYQFSDLGLVSLGATSAASTTQTLSLSHMYANQLRFQLTFLA